MLQKYYAAAGAEIKTYATQDEANNDLAAGRLDYVQADASALDAFLKTEQGTPAANSRARWRTTRKSWARAWAAGSARKTRR